MKWLLLIIVVVITAFWVKRYRKRNVFSEPDIKEVDQKRFYVTPPKPEDKPADDHENDRY